MCGLCLCVSPSVCQLIFSQWEGVGAPHSLTACSLGRFCSLFFSILNVEKKYPRVLAHCRMQRGFKRKGGFSKEAQSSAPHFVPVETGKKRTALLAVRFGLRKWGKASSKRLQSCPQVVGRTDGRTEHVLWSPLTLLTQHNRGGDGGLIKRRLHFCACKNPGHWSPLIH